MSCRGFRSERSAPNVNAGRFLKVNGSLTSRFSAKACQREPLGNRSVRRSRCCLPRGVLRPVLARLRTSEQEQGGRTKEDAACTENPPAAPGDVLSHKFATCAAPSPPRGAGSRVRESSRPFVFAAPHRASVANADVFQGSRRAVAEAAFVFARHLPRPASQHRALKVCLSRLSPALETWLCSTGFWQKKKKVQSRR